MRGLIEFAVKKPVALIMALSALILAGVFSAVSLPLQRLPDFSYPRVTVETGYPGMGAEDIRSIVTIPVEDALSPVKGLRRQRSVSRAGSSLVVLDFDWGTDSGAASVLVREAIDAVYPGLPDGVEKPAVIPGDPGEDPLIVAAVSSRRGGAFARNLAEYEIRSRLRRVEGVGAVIVAGGEKPELEIRTDLPRAVSRGLFPADIAGILSSETANIPAGNTREGGRELVVTGSGRPESEEELKHAVLPSERGPFVITDLGSVKTAAARKKTIFIGADKNGAFEKTALEVYGRPGADPVRLSREVRKAINDASGTFGGDLEIGVVFDDAPFITGGLWKLLISASLGCAAVMAVLFCTLRRPGYSILAGFSIPVSACASFTALALLGRSLNGMSVSGAALGIGLVSDTSVIILDLLDGAFGKMKNRPGFEALSRKAASVAASGLGGTLTTVVVFLPVVFLPGPLGSLFGDLSAALVFSIVSGWAYAQFALPGLYRLFFTGKTGPDRSPADRTFSVRGLYTKLFRRVLRNPLPLFAAAVLSSAAGIVFLFARPAVFVSPDEAREIEITLNFPAGTSLESMSGGAAELAEQAAGLSVFGAVFGRAGAEDEDSPRRASPDYSRETFILRCPLLPGSSPEKALGAVRELLDSGKLKKAPGAKYIADFPAGKTETLLGLSSPARLVVKGKDRKDVETNRISAEKKLLDSGLVRECTARPYGLRPEIRIRPDREASAFLGISAAETARAVYAALEGIAAAELEIDGRPLPVKVSGFFEGSPAGVLDSLPVALSENGPVFLGSLASMERRDVPSALLRLDRSDAVYLEPVPEQGKRAKLYRFLKDLYGKNGTGRADDSVFVKYRSSLILTIILVILLLYLSMGALFESFSLPLIFMLTIPFSLAGAGPALFLSGAGLDFQAVLGLMALFGIAVNSGMVLFERSEEKAKGGLSPEAAVYGAARDRLYPVLATTLTTAFALLPLALSPLGRGQRSMAAAMLGGICVSTLISLFALPPVFIRYLKRKQHE